MVTKERASGEGRETACKAEREYARRASLLPARIMHDSASRRALQASEEIELWRIGSSMAEGRETMGCGPAWVRSLPAEAPQVSRAFDVEDNPFLFKQLLLVSSRTDFTLGVDHPLPGDRGLWMVIT